MNNSLCCSELKRFIDAALDNFKCLDEYYTATDSELATLAKKLHIGKLTGHVSMNPAQVMESSNEAYDIHINSYESESGYENKPLVYSYTLGNGGQLSAEIYPQKNYEWNEEEEANALFITKLFVALASRASLFEIMTNSIYTDPVTKLLNPSGFMKNAAAISESNNIEDYAILFMNIKNFKYVNSVIGEREGDRVLEKYARVLKTQMHRNELVARFGGDNFVAIIRKENVDSFRKLISHMNVSTGAQSFELVTRAGISYCDNSGMGIPEYIDYANIAMGVSKIPGMPIHVVFEEAMLVRSHHQKRISSTFPKALRAREFVVYYQPKVRLEDKALCGAEALVRWISNNVIVPPLDFIPVLEKEGTVCQLDFYVLEEVCRTIAYWIKHGIDPVPVSVNFSKVHLINEELSDSIISVLKKYNVDGKYIEIELTEMSSHEDFLSLVNFVKAMADYGITTSIDDFGTGYSSLTLLKDLPVDIIKLDKSFVDGLIKADDKNTIVVTNTIHMIKQLDMLVLAEGVEEQSQADFLLSNGCDIVQGYLFDKPMPQADLENILNGRRSYI